MPMDGPVAIDQSERSHVMYRTLFPGDLFAEFERFQREAQRLAGPSTSLRGLGRTGFPALNR